MNSSFYPSLTYSCPAKLVRAELLHRLSTDCHQKIHYISHSISKYDSYWYSTICAYAYILRIENYFSTLDLGGWNPYSRTLEMILENPGTHIK